MGALAQYAPELAMRMQDRQRETQLADHRRDVMGRLFTGGGEAASPQGVLASFVNTPKEGPLQGYAPGAKQPPPPNEPGYTQPASLLPPVAAPSAGSALSGSQPVASDAPSRLVDPASLPARTDGMRLDPTALRELYALDPNTALEIQSSLYKSDAEGLKRVQAQGTALASAAFRLQQMRNADGTPDMAARTAELRAMAPMLAQMGVPAESLQSVDLSDNGLQRYGALYRNLSDVIRDDRADRRLTADIADDEADNERANMDTRDRMADRARRRALTARGQNMTDARGRYSIGVTSADRQRGQDIASTDRRRGQDITDRRVRETGGRRGGAAGGIPTVSSVAEARKLPSGTVFRTPDGKMKVRP
ncbi:hypothetical protein ASE65_15620 [Sphingomonas sp. Leaf16]|nr:hypothetical protein ASE65_15620 [Sphingomonas sp. Leaf16]KQN22812.1 hypothetical protein ASE83_15600 [Sphingomonas sp. Leaf32]